MVVDSDNRSAAVEAELFGDAKRTDKPFILANALFLSFDQNLKITHWTDHLDTFTLAKYVLQSRTLAPERAWKAD